MPTFICPSCEKEIKVAISSHTRHTHCPHCEEKIEIPSLKKDKKPKCRRRAGRARYRNY